VTPTVASRLAHPPWKQSAVASGRFEAKRFEILGDNPGRTNLLVVEVRVDMEITPILLTRIKTLPEKEGILEGLSYHSVIDF
jgi:hypothetical protein